MYPTTKLSLRGFLSNKALFTDLDHSGSSLFTNKPANTEKGNEQGAIRNLITLDTSTAQANGIIENLRQGKKSCTFSLKHPVNFPRGTFLPSLVKAWTSLEVYVQSS